MKIDLSGKVALVTGASRGIGEAIALRLGEAGAKVLCAARSREAVEKVANAIRESGGQAAPVEIDIASEGAREIVEGLIAEHGSIDILVNNAGVTADDLFLRMKKDAWDRVLRTNLDSIYPITQVVVKKMMRNRWGRLINVSSVVGITGNPGQANYAASKAAIIGFTKSLALELGSRGITSNAVAPGFVATAMTDQMTDEAKSTMESRIALGRLGTPDDIAHAVVFLASEQASYITGTVMNVSGGLVT